MFLAAVSPWFVGYTVLARPYFVCLCFSIAATAIAFEIHDGSRKTVASVLFAAVSALGLYTIYHYAFVVGWHLLFLLVSATRREPGERFREVLRVAPTLTSRTVPQAARQRCPCPKCLGAASTPKGTPVQVVHWAWS